ncbi:thioredoxin domain-containing protein [Cystoisospora suis]|uniref:Thioredoxin domain-containing protein n=1 Tax=Cystoisospora suis TaxID=483139 RepID=A0A2C6KVR8_9APIC|nr:thioredoxin domain-containing protein [Cystoisospora suis]
MSSFTSLPTAPAVTAALKKRQNAKKTMRRTRNFFVFLGASSLVALCVLASAAASSASAVKELTDATFEHDTQASTGATTGDWFVKFYAPWCGHCKAMAAAWEDLAKELKGKINVAKLDATSNSITAKRFKIQGFPTLYYLSKVCPQATRLLDRRRDMQKLLACSNAYSDPCFRKWSCSEHASHSSVVCAALLRFHDLLLQSRMVHAGGRKKMTYRVSQHHEVTQRWLTAEVIVTSCVTCLHCVLTSMEPSLYVLLLGQSCPALHTEQVSRKTVETSASSVALFTVLASSQGKMYEYRGERSVEKLKAFAEGGWKSVQGEAIPAPLSTLDVLKDEFISAFLQLQGIVYHAPLPFFLLFFIGVASGCMLTCLCNFCCSKRDQKRSAVTSRSAKKKD